jgi:hypothetical protein
MTYACFDVTRNAGIARIMHMSYRSKTYTWNDVILVKRSMIRVFYTDGLTVPRHAQHCDGQWLILDSYCASFKLLCHVVRMHVLTSNYHIANDTWPDAHYRIAVRESPDVHCVIALWRRIGFLMELLVTGKISEGCVTRSCLRSFVGYPSHKI